MRAAVFEQAGTPLAIREVSTPEPGPGELLIRVHRCGICGTDLHMTDAHSVFNPPPGSIIGHEFAGEVVALGEGTQGAWKEGDRLAALPYIGCGECVHCLAGDPTQCARVRSQPSGEASGGYAEYSAVSAMNSVKLSSDLSWEEGAFVEPVAVGIHAVAKAAMTVGAKVLIIGAGPVGLAVAACARLGGAANVVVAARTDRRAQLALTMGASEFMLADEKLGDNFAKLAGGMPEIVVECAGVPGMMDLAAGLAAPRGRVVMAGACLQTETFVPIVATMKELTYQFAVCYTRQEFALAEKLISARRIDPMPMFDGTVTLDQLPERFEELRSDKRACKVMLAP
ncbi:MAG: alcohol dehydrogenase catalytic domain-containing protein [Sphingobium sp.]